MDRIDKLISENSSLSRSQAKDEIKKGKVIVNGASVKDPKTKADIDNDIILLNGEKIMKKGFTYIIMNKPAGFVCAARDRTEKTVMELLPSELKRKDIFPAGRLDKDTTGLLLLTDDGDFAHRLIHPKTHASKIYLAELSRDAEDGYAERFRQGIVLADGSVCQPAGLIILKNKRKCFVTLYEGKYHQVKRMFAACGNHVEKLCRIAIGNYFLDPEMKPGECVVLLHKEHEKLLIKSEPEFLPTDIYTFFSS